MKTMTVSDARTHLPELIDRVHGSPKETVEIIRHGEPVAAIMSVELYEALVETIEILSDEKTAKLLKDAIKRAKRAKFIPLTQVRKELGIEA